MGSVVVAVLVALLGSGALAALVTALMQRGKTRADAAAIGVTAQSTVIQNLMAQNARLTERLDAMDSRVERVEASERRKGKLVELMSAWQRRVWRTLTDEQKTTVGEPPTDADLPGMGD